MPAADFFARLVPQFARQWSDVHVNARRHAEADALITRAEYEYFDVQRELMAAFALPLRNRAIALPAPEREDATSGAG